MMIRISQPFFCILVVGMFSFFFTGCGTTQPRQFFILTSIEDVDIGTTASLHDVKDKRIGVGPVSFPKYLDRTAMILRRSDSEVVLNEEHRWAEPLENNFIQVLTRNLQTFLNNTHITSLPWRNNKAIDYQVEIDVSRFDADINGNVVLSAQWTIRRKKDNRDLYSQKSLFTEKAESNTPAAFVQKQSKLTAQLSQAIASKLGEMITSN